MNLLDLVWSLPAAIQLFRLSGTLFHDMPQDGVVLLEIAPPYVSVVVALHLGLALFGVHTCDCSIPFLIQWRDIQFEL